ncbi:MAG: DEAD/DEAH box helicase family protein [Candidatus Poribacteria bacterium]|nr:DEAD/DEAH box helicase family protein [Candidatus Poribacteria bacterium]
MELKNYQSSALETFERWQKALDEARLESARISKVIEDANGDVPWEICNYPKRAWDALKAEGIIPNSTEYVDRKDEMGRPIPHVCFKVPTGGGKTLMAASALERLNRANGLTLWIVPTTAIYDQTKNALWRRAHPYRKMLERASGGRVKVLEKKKLETGKDGAFIRSDVDNFLCVMLMTYQALNRTNNREFLRLFRDNSKYTSFFPDSDDYAAHERLKKQYPDLKDQSRVVIRSLHNVFKMMRPVVVLDEAHKTVGSSWQIERVNRSVRELNPSLIIEISATPKPEASNLLVNIGGVPLHKEEMIKLPIWVAASDEIDWQDTLKNAHTEMEKLAVEAKNLYENEGRYIRPIAVVRVERTGKNHRGGIHIHAEDAREYLLDNLGVRPQEVVVKSSELDELGRQDLLSDNCEIRWIITKDALKEGWDCSFAYMLVMLDRATERESAITQLVGRVLRQPHARRTGRKALDQCYVHCCNTNVRAVVSKVKSGLEEEGLTGLVGATQSSSIEAQSVTIQRREAFRDHEILLPKLMHKDESGWIEYDYDIHILSEIDWNEITAPGAQGSMPQPSSIYTAGVGLSDSGDLTYDFGSSEIRVDKQFKLEWYVRRLSDIVPNPWQAARIVMEYAEKMRSIHSEDALYDHRAWIVDHLRMHVNQEIERIAEEVYCDKLESGAMRFGPDPSILDHRVNKNPFDLLIDENDRSLECNVGQPIQRSLFDPVMETEFDSNLEREIACYLDDHNVIQWWDRIAARRSGEYYLRGWKPERIWPDFVAAAGKIEGEKRLLVLETKGEHLSGNRDTEYKKEVLKVLEDAYNRSTAPGQGSFEKVTLRLVYDKAELMPVLASMGAEAQPLSP